MILGLWRCAPPPPRLSSPLALDLVHNYDPPQALPHLPCVLIETVRTYNHFLCQKFRRDEPAIVTPPPLQHHAEIGDDNYSSPVSGEDAFSTPVPATGRPPPGQVTADSPPLLGDDDIDDDVNIVSPMVVAPGQQGSPAVSLLLPPLPPRREEVTGGGESVKQRVGEDEAIAVARVAVANATTVKPATTARERRKALGVEQERLFNRRAWGRAGNADDDARVSSVSFVGAPPTLNPPAARETHHSFSGVAVPVVEVHRRASGGAGVVVVGRGGGFRGKNSSGTSSSSGIGAAPVAGGSSSAATMSEGAGEQRDEAAARGRRILETEGAVENMRRRLSAMGFLEADAQSGGGGGGGGGSGGNSGGGGVGSDGAKESVNGQGTASLNDFPSLDQVQSERVIASERGIGATSALGATGAAARPQIGASPSKEDVYSAEAYRRARGSVAEITMATRHPPGGGVSGAKRESEGGRDKPPLTSTTATGMGRGVAADRNTAGAGCSAAASTARAEAGPVKRRGMGLVVNRDGAKAGAEDEARRVPVDTATSSPTSGREDESWRPATDRRNQAPSRSSSSSLSSFSSRRGSGERAEAKAEINPSPAFHPSVKGAGTEAIARPVGGGEEHGGRQYREEGSGVGGAVAAPGLLHPMDHTVTPTTLHGGAGGEDLGELSGLTPRARDLPPTCEQGTPPDHGAAVSATTSEALSVDVSPAGEGDGDVDVSSRGKGTDGKRSNDRRRSRRHHVRGLPTASRGQAEERVHGRGGGGVQGQGQVVLPRPDAEYEEALLRLTAAAAHAAELYRELVEASASSVATRGTGTGTERGSKGSGAESFASMRPSSGSPGFREAGREPVDTGKLGVVCVVCRWCSRGLGGGYPYNAWPQSLGP